MDRFIPDMYQKSIYHIDYDKLKEDGIKCLLFDLDNTCVPFKDKEPNKKLKDLFDTLKDMDFKVIIYSNATKKRLTPFKNELGVDCSASSRKPSKKKLLKILKMFKYDLSDVVIIGDQLYTDILCGNRVGIKTILVNPMSKDDLIFTKLFRFFEKGKFRKMAKMGILKKGKYYE
jgi:HAD superfamily phosphatase (TIGR01668 family)